MYSRILIATDGSEVAERAVEQGLRLAMTLGTTEVRIITVTDPASIVGAGYATIAGTIVDPIPELLQAQAEASRNIIKSAEAIAANVGVRADTAVIDDNFPAEAIVADADRHGSELIVMGSHGRRGLGRLLLGSQTTNVLTHSKIPVLVIR